MNRITRLAAAILGPAAFLIAAAGIGAASASTTGNYTGAGVQISPTRIEIHLNAQGRATQTFLVENPGSKPTIITLGAATFRQQDSGQLALTAPNLPGSVTGLSWITATPSEFRLGPSQIRKVTVHIAEPASASPGQRYVAVMFTANPAHRVKGQVAARIAVTGELLIDTGPPRTRVGMRQSCACGKSDESGRRPVLLAGVRARLEPYGGHIKHIMRLRSTMDENALTAPPLHTLPLGVDLWMTEPTL